MRWVSGFGNRGPEVLLEGVFAFAKNAFHCTSSVVVVVVVLLLLLEGGIIFWWTSFIEHPRGKGRCCGKTRETPNRSWSRKVEEGD